MIQWFQQVYYVGGVTSNRAMSGRSLRWICPPADVMRFEYLGTAVSTRPFQGEGTISLRDQLGCLSGDNLRLCAYPVPYNFSGSGF